MITIDDIIKASGLHKSRVHNIYVFGSRVYETHSDNSDWDIVVVANNSVEAIEIKSDLYNIHIYTPKKFQEDLDWHMPKNIECIFAPSWAKLQERIKFDFTSANFIWNKLMRTDSDWCNYSDLPSVSSYKSWTWKELDEDFRELRNEILTDFRKVTEK